MSISALGLLESVGAHLAADAGLVALVGADGVFHARVDADQTVPFLLYRLARVSHRDAQGFGGDVESGQTPEVTLLVSAIDEASDPKQLSPIADAVDDAVRSWTPVGWSVLERTLTEERTDAHESEGQTLQALILSYRIILERT